MVERDVQFQGIHLLQNTCIHCNIVALNIQFLVSFQQSEAEFVQFLTRQHLVAPNMTGRSFESTD